MPTWRPITIPIPDFETFSDEELGRELVMRDGPWSPLIKGALASLGATELDLNAHWASVHQEWTCPACKRPKADLLRITKNGVLKANLELHHDHLANYFKAELRRRFGLEWSAKLFEQQRHISHLGIRLILRFDNTLICSDCNVVDGLVKGKPFGVDEFFSFRPTEIGRCVIPRSRATHDIDYEKAEAIWNEVKEDFRERQVFVTVLLDKVASGGLMQEPGHAPHDDLHISRVLLRYLDANPEGRSFIYDAIENARHRSQARPINLRTKASGSKKRALVPTEQEFVQFDQAVVSTKWKLAGNDWLCPICERSKRQILRRSKAKAWFAAIYEHIEFCAKDMGSAADDPYSITIAPIDHHHSILVCADCAHIISEVRRRHGSVDLSKSYLTLEQIKSVICIASNESHVVDWGEAISLAVANSAQVIAINAYWDHWHETKHVHVMFELLAKDFLNQPETQFDALVQVLRSSYADKTEAKLKLHLSALLKEALRLPGIVKAKGAVSKG